jgi:hypothetical protein
MRTHGPLRVVFLFSLLSIALVLAGCDEATGLWERARGIVDSRSEQAPAPTDGWPVRLPTLAPTAVTPEPTAAPAADQPTPWPTSTTDPSLLGAAQAAPTAIPSPTPSPAQDLLFVDGDRLMRGGELGEAAREVAPVHNLGAWSLVETRLALLQGTLIQTIDFATNGQSSLTVDAGGAMESAEILVGRAGTGILHVATVSDPGAPTWGRHVEVRALRVADGTLTGGMMIPDVAGATVLAYDDALEQALIAPLSGDRSFSRVDLYDLVGRALLASYPVRGEGAAVLSPDGTRLLTCVAAPEGSELLIYDLSGDEPGAPLFWELPAGSRAASYAWSPDGRRVAYLLGEGEDVAEGDLGGVLGAWVLDLETMTAGRAIAEQGSGAALVGWSADGGSIVIYHSEGEESAHYYMVRPDGGGLRILPVHSQARLLGWLPRAVSAPSERVEIDPWRARFAATVGDAEALAAMAAAYVAEHPDVDDALLSEALAVYLAEAGWENGPAVPSVRRLGDGIYAAQLPSLAVYLLSGGAAQRIARSDVLLDARLEGEEIGLIYAVAGATEAQPAYALLRRVEGAWSIGWTPQGRRDWIATDGEIAFSGEGLAALTVTGTSFGLDYGPDSLFAECQECPHRLLTGRWVRDGQGYRRETTLGEDAPLDEVLWEMSARSPYAVLHEAFRRLVRGGAVEELLADRRLRGALEGLNPAGAGARFVPDEETEESVTFIDARDEARYRAVVRDGRLVALEALGSGD